MRINKEREYGIGGREPSTVPLPKVALDALADCEEGHAHFHLLDMARDFMTTTRAVADWGDLYLEKPRIDENPPGGQISVADSSPTAQIRSVQARQS